MNERTIWRFQLAVHDEQMVRMPQGARILTAQAQDRVITVWAEVDPLAPLENRRFEIHGTGNPIFLSPSGQTRTYVASVQSPPYVWHVYVVEPA